MSRTDFIRYKTYCNLEKGKKKENFSNCCIKIEWILGVFFFFFFEELNFFSWFYLLQRIT